MGISIKNNEQIEFIRESCRVVIEAHKFLAEMIRPGVSTIELDRAAAEIIRRLGGIPAFRNYRGFPGNICTSVNDEVIHGVPSGRRLKNGDIISVDIGVSKNGFFGDAARTHIVGQASAKVLWFAGMAEECFFEGVKLARAGHRLHEISNAIADHAEKNNCSVVVDYVGHGIGRQLHEDPNIPHSRQTSKGPRLYKGMTLAIEPMVTFGAADVELSKDGQTVLTKDGSLACHYENTVLITDDEPILLTLPQESYVANRSDCFF